MPSVDNSRAAPSMRLPLRSPRPSVSHRPLVTTLLLFAVASLCGQPAPAPDAWTRRVWRSDDGLPNNHVTGLARTNDGYLWVATYSMPARFDGMRFEAHAPKDMGLGSHQKISALAPSTDGGLWLGTLHGAVVLLDSRRLSITTEELPYKPVESLVEDGKRTLWISHQGGTLHRLKDGVLTMLGPEHGIPPSTTPDRYVCSLAVDTSGIAWLSKDGHVGTLEGDRFQSFVRLAPANARLGAARGGGMWIYAEGQLLRFVAGQPPQRLGEIPARPGTDAHALLEDRHGHVWIGTTGGLFHYDGRRIQLVPTSDPRISSLLEDDKGHLWVGTVGGGLNSIVPRVISLETTETGIPTGIVQSLAADATGRLWATTQSGLLLRRSPDGSWQTLSSDPAWPGGRAATVAADAEGAVWIGTRDRALHRWKAGAYSSWRRVNGLASREIHGLVVARNGDVWLALSTPDVVQRLRNGKFDTFPMPEGIRVIRAIAEDAADNIWVGSSKGMLVRIRNGVVTDETPSTSGQPLSIRCLHATPDGSLWIGYADEGIGWWKSGRFIHISPTLGLPEPNVSQIVADGTGWLWFAGDHGIFKVWQTDLESLALGHLEQAHFIRYGPSEGLSSVEANFGDSPGAARTPDGRLWIPLRTALAVVDPARAQPDPTPPAVVLKRVAVDERTLAAYTHPVPVRDALDLRDAAATPRLSAGHHRVSFEFAALAFASPENVRLRHRLEGLDESWSDAGTARSATFSRLPPGRYRFHLQACNSDGVWNEAGASFIFVVTPFVWQTWWFRLSALAVLVAAIVAIVRMVSLRRIQTRLRLLEQQAALHKERTRIARDLHDEFGTRLTELGLLAELERNPSSELIAHIRALERDLDTIVWAVNPRNDTLDHLVGFICRVAGDFLARSSLRCRFAIPDDLPARPLSPELRHHLFLVVREALNNIVKHASATLVKLTVALEGDLLRLTIENDGPGFSVAAAEAGARNGLRNMRARIEELGGRFELTSSPEAGSVLIVCVPLPPTSVPASSSIEMIPTRPQPAH